MTKKLKQIPSCGYELLGCFTVNENTWWCEYYRPLEKRIHELREKYSDDPLALAVLDKEQREVDMFKRNPKRFSSVFFVMQKNNPLYKKLSINSFSRIGAGITPT